MPDDSLKKKPKKEERSVCIICMDAYRLGYGVPKSGNP
jgi:hypothetical protein